MTAAYCYSTFQSTHPVWDGTLPPLSSSSLINISIHPSRVGWDRCRSACGTFYEQFQSTHPVWDGTTSKLRAASMRPSFQSTHPVWDGTQPAIKPLIVWRISIHPSRVGWDLYSHAWENSLSLFQSTHPVWDGTDEPVQIIDLTKISIHPSRVGWDDEMGTCARRPLYFNPPIPCGMGR